MGLLSRWVGRALGLPAPRSRRVRLTRGLSVVMPDGVQLLADHYAPQLPGAPTVLVRTPYGRGATVRVLARAVAECGFHVVLQSCRGTADSGGLFEPMRHERADGLETLAWLRAQPWYSGRLCTFGPSYVGFTQWAIAAEAGAELAAMVTIVTASDFRGPTYSGGAFSLETVLSWAAQVQVERSTRLADRLASFLERRRGQPRLTRGLAHLPLAEADLVATGATQPFVREWLAEPGDGYWAERGHDRRVPEVGAAVLMIGGWQDIFLPWQLADYAALRSAGARPRLMIGAWTHNSPALLRTSVREAVAWMRAHTDGGARSDLGVRVHVGGVDEWRELPGWPPSGGGTRDWFLIPGGGLGAQPAAPTAKPDRFRYDPADPTPAIGGPRLAVKIAGRRDNRSLESRPDVLVYTSGPLARPVEVLGPVSATVRVRADSRYFDVFVRLCDVEESGPSWNVCDGLIRVTDTEPGEIAEITVPMWPAAHRFLAGHRIRVQVSAGAHPRFSRNPGTGEPLATATTLRPVVLEVYPSVLHLTTVE